MIKKKLKQSVVLIGLVALLTPFLISTNISAEESNQTTPTTSIKEVYEVAWVNFKNDDVEKWHFLTKDQAGEEYKASNEGITLRDWNSYGDLYEGQLFDTYTHMVTGIQYTKKEDWADFYENKEKSENYGVIYRSEIERDGVFINSNFEKEVGGGNSVVGEIRIGANIFLAPYFEIVDLENTVSMTTVTGELTTPTQTELFTSEESASNTEITTPDKTELFTSEESDQNEGGNLIIETTTTQEYSGSNSSEQKTEGTQSNYIQNLILAFVIGALSGFLINNLINKIKERI